jgi:hypothetical protein
MAGLGLGEAGATLRPASSRAGSDDSKNAKAVHTGAPIEPSGTSSRSRQQSKQFTR